MIRQFLKDSVVYSIPSLLSRGIGVLLVPVYTRVLSTADYGALDIITVIASIVNLTVALEVSQGLARHYSDAKDPDTRVGLASTAFWFTVACYVCFGVAALVFSSQLSSWCLGKEGLETEFRIGVLYMVSAGIFYISQNQFRWELRSLEYAITSMIMTLVSAGSAVWLAWGAGMGLQGFLWGMTIGSLAGTLSGAWYLRRSFQFRFEAGLLRKMLIFSIPLIPSGIAVWVNNYISRIMINSSMSLDDVGLYGIGFRLVSIVSLLMIGFQTSLTPLVYKYHAEPDTPRQLARIFRIFVAGALLMSVALTLFAHDALVLMTTPQFYAGASVVVFLLPAVFLSQMYLFMPGVAIARQTHWYIWINVSGALINLGLNFLLIPPMGIQGAALASLSGALTVFLFHTFLSQKLYPVPHRWTNLLGATAIAVMLVAVVPQIDTNDWLRRIYGGISLIAMFASLILLRLIRIEEIGQGLRSLLRFARARTASADGVK
jgi:O-antigen/teichoic acid export membrane protein